MTKPKRVGVLSEKAVDYFPIDARYVREIERAVLLAAARRLNVDTAVDGRHLVDAIFTLREWAKEIPR